MTNATPWAQPTGSSAIDESKLPEWVKRQAQSPIKLIIHSGDAGARSDGTATRPAKVPAKKPLAVAGPASAPASAPAPVWVAGPDKTTSPEGHASTAAAEASAPGQAPPSTDHTALIDPGAIMTQPVPGAGPLTPLTLLDRVEPRLTPDLIDEALKAHINMKFTVSTDGKVENVRVVSGGNRRLNQAVLRAISQWRYAPLPEPREHWIEFQFKQSE